MNPHAMIDRMTVVITALALGNHKFFRDGLESPGYREHLEGVHLQFPDIDAQGRYEIPACTLVGELDPAVCLARWKGPGYPTIIYHHGNNEDPLKDSFKRLLLDQGEIPTNLIALQAPFHSAKIYREKIGELTNFVAMLAVSVKVTEAVIAWLRAQGRGPLVVSGISLGGWVCNLHRSFYNSADIYVPLLAGTALDDVFVNSAYRKLASRDVEESPELVRQVLNFQAEFEAVKSNNVFPLLARHDQFVRYKAQKGSYGDHEVAVLDKGHVTAALAYEALRYHLLEQLERIQYRQKLRYNVPSRSLMLPSPDGSGMQAIAPCKQSPLSLQAERA